MTWNVFHGRDWPPDPRLQIRAHKGNFRRGPRLGERYEQTNWDLLDRFAPFVKDIDWDVALFQEFPPAWKRKMAAACGANAHRAFSGRNWFQPLTSLIGRWRPDLLGAWEGGSNTTLVRPAAGSIADRHRVVLTRNHEIDGDTKSFAGAALTYDPRADGGTVNLIFNTITGKLERSWASLSGTCRNGSGGATPWA